MNLISRLLLVPFSVIMLMSTSIYADGSCLSDDQLRSCTTPCISTTCPATFTPNVCPVVTGTVNCTVPDVPGGVDIFYRQVGTCGDGRPTIFFIHGFGLSSAVWQCVQQLLCGQYCTIAVDLIGHGQSGRPNVASAYSVEAISNQLICVMNELGVTNPIIVGLSFGGSLALSLVVDFAAQVNASKLILLGSSPAPLPEAPGNPLGLSAAAFAAIGANLVVNPSLANFATAWSALVVNETCPGIATTVEQIRQIALQADLFALQSIVNPAVNPAASFNFVADLPNITIPTLITRGTIDAIVGLAAAQALRNSIPNSVLVEFDGKGHTPNVTDFFRFSTLLGNFANGNDLLCALCNLSV